MSNPAFPPAIQFERIRVCNYCGTPTEERYENSVCLECQMSVEGERPVYLYECSKCHELCDEEICNCEELARESANEFNPED